MAQVEYTCICGRPLTQREASAIRRKAKEAQKEAVQEKLKPYSSKPSLVSDRIFTKGQIALLLEKGILRPIEEGGKTYFLKTEVVKASHYLASLGMFYD